MSPMLKTFWDMCSCEVNKLSRWRCWCMFVDVFYVMFTAGELYSGECAIRDGAECHSHSDSHHAGDRNQSSKPISRKHTQTDRCGDTGEADQMRLTASRQTYSTPVLTAASVCLCCEMLFLWLLKPHLEDKQLLKVGISHAIIFRKIICYNKQTAQ